MREKMRYRIQKPWYMWFSPTVLNVSFLQLPWVFSPVQMPKEEGQHFRPADACGAFVQRIYKSLGNPAYIEDGREFSSLVYGKNNPSSTKQESCIRKKGKLVHTMMNQVLLFYSIGKCSNFFCINQIGGLL